jgi:hypothetical protein
MTPNDLLNHFTRKADIARAAGVARQTVHGWFLSGSVPIDAQMRLEVATGGRCLADVSDDFRRVAAQGIAA